MTSAIVKAYAQANRTTATRSRSRATNLAPLSRLSARKLARGVYDGTETSRQTADWAPGSLYPQPLTAQWLELLRQRSRSLARTASIVVTAFTAIKDNVVGADGFRLRPRPRPLADANDPDAVDDTLARSMTALWKDHSSAIDIDRRESLTDLLRCAIGEYPEAGEVFVVESAAPSSDPNGVVPQVISLVAAENCDHSLDSRFMGPRVAEGSRVTNGIEFDGFGRRTAYHFRKTDAFGLPAQETKRVPAERVFHLFHRLRAGQERGLPWLYSSTMLAHDLDDLIDSELTSAQVAACLAAFVKTESGQSIFEEDPNTDRDSDTDRPILGLEPGMVAYLAPGEEIDTIDPHRPGNTFDPFAAFLIRQLGKSLGPGYETISGDYRRVNFASGRLAHLVERKAYRRIQAITTNLVVRPVYRSFVRRAVLAGRLPISPDEYITDARRFDRVDIQPPGWEHHDPLKEATAAAIRILVGISTLDEEAGALGRDWRATIEQRGKEVAAMNKAGLVQFGIGGAVPVPAPAAAASAQRLQASATRLGFDGAIELITALEDGAIKTFEANGGRLNGVVAQEIPHANA